MIDVSFAEGAQYAIVNVMARAFVTTACILALSAVFASCSFNYAEGDGEGKVLPEMVMTDAVATRYESSKVNVVFRAKVLEVYDSDKVWAAEGVSFTEYAANGSGDVHAEGSAGILVIDDGAGVYTLGKGTTFRVLEDDVFLTAPDLRWRKKENALAGPDDGMVEVREKDGTVIRGTGFFADTLRRSYRFSGKISGEFVRGSTLSGETGEAE